MGKIIIRKRDRERVFDVIKTIEQAQQNDCFQIAQQGVEAIINFVDGIYNEDTETVNLLVKHFEALYKAGLGEVDKEYLDEHLHKIKNTASIDLKPNHIEMAFLPHLAACSGALETIYFAADKDPGCDAYWVPIPTFLGNNTKNIFYQGQEHYPSIPCVPWEEYNIKERRPDAIFVFFAYERSATIRVFDEFLCENLKNLTDMLVFVPYYVDIDEYSFLNDVILSHACFYHIHKAIVGTKTQLDIILSTRKKILMQDLEIIKNIKNIDEKAIADNLTEYLENFDKKFVALGSPMYDKAITATKQQLPKEWESKIKDKKVIVYASSVGSVATNEDYLKKVIYILSTFEKRRDVVLWFRPHPYMELHFHGERLNMYTKLINEYISSGFGIYDDTSDLYRAIAWGDGLYSDPSSVLLLYQATGKPVMMANNCGAELHKKMKAGCNQIGGFRFEDETDTLERFIDDVLNYDSSNIRPTIAPNIGENIYNYIKSAINED